MINLYNKIKKFNLNDAINFEEKDRQFLALKNLYKNKLITDTNYLFLIISNSLICYQLSGKGEDYWEEFSENLKNKEFSNFEDIYNFFENFIRESKNNRRFIDTKLKRLKKLELFYENFIGKSEYYYKNMDSLVLDLSTIMNQKSEAKTIVFAVKMFSYGARNIYNFEYFPEKIMIPIDSRLENLYKKYEDKEEIDKKEIKDFYLELSKKVNIPLLHLDAILWVNYEGLINK